MTTEEIIKWFRTGPTDPVFEQAANELEELIVLREEDGGAKHYRNQLLAATSHIATLLAHNEALREELNTASENFVKMCVLIERAGCSCYTLSGGMDAEGSGKTHVECERCKALHEAECMKNSSQVALANARELKAL